MKQCPACHSDNTDEAKFCTVCGNPFPESEGSNAPEKDDNLNPATGISPASTMPEADGERIENEAVLDRKLFNACSGNQLYIGILGILFGVVCLILRPVLKDTDFDFLSDILTVCAFITFVSGFVCLFIYLKTYAQLMKKGGTRILCRFGEEEMWFCRYTGGEKIVEVTVGYSTVIRIQRAKGALVLYIPSGIWPISDSGYTKGTRAGLEALLQRRCPPSVPGLFPKKK